MGKRERQKRRGELLSAELTLERVMLHLRNAAAWAARIPDPEQRDYKAVAETFARVKLRLLDVMDEQKALD